MSETVPGSVLGFSVDTLDDTLHAVVQVTRDHDLPVDGASVHSRDVLVYCDLAAMTVWVRWLAAGQDRRIVAWRDDDGVHLHAGSHREGINWATCATVSRDDLTRAGMDADKLRDVAGNLVASAHVPVDPELMCALLEAAVAGGESR